MEGLALPDGARKGPNCGVTAVAIAAQKPFDEVFRYFKAGRKGNYRGRTTDAQRYKVMQALGVKWTACNMTVFGRVTLRNWARYAKKDTLYMVRTTGHVQMFYNNIVTDQLGPIHISEHPLAGRRVLHVDIIHLDNFKTAQVQNFSEVKKTLTANPETPVAKKHWLHIGQIVSFSDKYGRRHTGRILKKNPKCAKIIVNGATIWRVSYNLLTIVEQKIGIGQ